MHTDYTKKWLKITFKRWAHLLWKDLISSMFLKIASFWLVTSGGASELSACFRWWEVKNSTSLTNSDSPFISSWISWLEAQINSLLWFFGWFALSRQTCFTYNNFLLYSPSDTSSTLVSGRSPASADSCNRNFNFFKKNITQCVQHAVASWKELSWDILWVFCPGRPVRPSLGGMVSFWWVWSELTTWAGEPSPKPQHTVPLLERWNLCSPRWGCNQLLLHRYQTSIKNIYICVCINNRIAGGLEAIPAVRGWETEYQSAPRLTHRDR